jgi:hypothetical protein
MLTKTQHWIAGASALLGGCAIDLEPGADARPHEQSTPQHLESCALLEGAADSIQGLATSVSLPNGQELLVAQASLEGSEEVTAFSAAGGSCGEAAPALEVRPVIDASRFSSRAVATPRAGFTTDAAYLYFSLLDEHGFDSSGGIARFDDDTGKFQALALLWTSDRPTYGAGAVVSGDFVYVYGGLAARFLAADVYLSRVTPERVTEPNAYEYFAGGGEWTPDADLARPVVEGGQWPSVVWNEEHERFVMAYSAPLAREIQVRSGLAPSGPWSLPYVLGACTLPFPEAFCGGVSHLPSFADDGGIALAQSISTLEAPPNGTALDYWTQLVRAPWPAALP